MSDASASTPPSPVRLDVWLDVACLFRTRSEAQRACVLGRITVNGQAAKARRLLRTGDVLTIARPHGRKQELVVQGLADRHLKKTDAHQLYEDRTPAPTPDELEALRLERLYRAATVGTGAPHKRDRRALRAAKGKV